MSPVQRAIPHGVLLLLAVLCICVHRTHAHAETHYTLHTHTTLDAQTSTDRTTDSEMVFTPIRDAVARGAVCMDGTVAGYYTDLYNPSTAATSRSDDWLVYLEGGGACSDDYTCLTRYFNGPTYGLTLERSMARSSTRDVPRTMRARNLLDADPNANPQFHHYNKIYGE